MSETEREQEIVLGVIQGITQKGEDKWQVAVKPDGSEYTKNLWTKSRQTVDALSSLIGEHRAFVCSVSHWTNQSGKPVRSLWLENIQQEGQAAPAQAAPQKVVEPDVDWDAKERRDYRSRAWAQTLAAFQHTIKVDEDPAAVFTRLQPFQRKVFEDVCQSFSYPADDSDIPF